MDDITAKRSGPYIIEDAQLFKKTKEGRDQLTNFSATIEEELAFHDGAKVTTVLKISGLLHDDQGNHVALPVITVDASEFASASWVPAKWGMRPICFPTSSNAADLKTAIQLFSKAKRTHIYTHTGWTKIQGKDTYLSSNGGLSADGLDRSLTVQLPEELNRYALPAPTKPTASELAAVLKLTQLAPGHVTWVLLLATIRSVVRASDFAIHLAGRTGTFKSEISSLFQSFHGSAMDARHLPCSWNSTANALEALCHKTKDALVVVDDFVPQGTSYHVRGLQQKADHLIRAQGNQSGKQRMTDTMGAQSTFFPRGLILSTGEDIPEGHSVRARMLIIELAPGDIAADRLTAAQANKPIYNQFTANFIHWLCNNPELIETQKELAKQERDARLGIGHSRTPGILGELMATAMLLKEYAAVHNIFDEPTREQIVTRAKAALEDAGDAQSAFQEETDPVTTFCEIVQQMLSTGMGHVKTKTGGVPLDPTAFGWVENGMSGEYPTYKSLGPKLGWVDLKANEFLFDPNAFALIKGKSNGKLAVTATTLAKRMKEGGLITRTDAARQRNTVRLTIEDHPRNVLILDLQKIVSTETAMD